MKKGLVFLILVAMCILIAAGAYFWAMAMMDSNFSYRSPIKDNPPPADEPVGEVGTNRVVIVLMDALRYDTSLKADVMPALNNLRTLGTSAVMHSRPPSFSEPGYTTILTGAWPDLNDGPSINLDYEEIPQFTQDNLFSAVKRKGLSTAISGYYWFEKLVPQKDVDFSFYTPGEDAVADSKVVVAALKWLDEENVQLVLIHIDQIDYAGHYEGGALSSNWDAAARRSDKLLAEILERMDLSQETIVVLSDHGQIDAGGHGGNEPVTLIEPFVMAGKGVKPGSYHEIQMVDVAPTIAALLGTNLPASTQGEVLTDMLELPESTLNNLPAATRQQQTLLLESYTTSMSLKTPVDLPHGSNVGEYQQMIEQLHNQRLFKNRIWRSLAAAVFLALAITFMIKYWKNKTRTWTLTGMITLGLFQLRYALIDQKSYSISSVTGEMDLILYVGVTTLASFVLAWLLISITQHPFHKQSSEAANNVFHLGFGSIFILFLPVVISFVLNGPVVTWTLPEYTSSYLALLGLIQIIMVSLTTPLLVGITALIARMKKHQPLFHRSKS